MSTFEEIEYLMVGLDRATVKHLRDEFLWLLIEAGVEL